MRVALVVMLVIDILFETITGLVHLVNMARIPEQERSWNLPSLPPGDIDPRHLVVLAATVIVLNCLVFWTMVCKRFPAAAAPILFIVGLAVSAVQQFYLGGYTFASLVTVACILYALWVKLRFRHMRFLQAWTGLVTEFLVGNHKVVFVSHLLLSTVAQLVVIALGAASYSWVVTFTTTSSVTGVFATVLFCLTTWCKTQLVLYYFHMRLCRVILKWTNDDGSQAAAAAVAVAAVAAPVIGRSWTDEVLLWGQLLEFSVLIVLADLLALGGCCVQAGRFGVVNSATTVARVTTHTRSVTAQQRQQRRQQDEHQQYAGHAGHAVVAMTTHTPLPSPQLQPQPQSPILDNDEACCSTLESELGNYNMYSLTASACLARTRAVDTSNYWGNLSTLMRHRFLRHPLRVGVVAEHNLTVYMVFFLAACVGVWSGFILTWVQFTRANVTLDESRVGRLDALETFRPYLAGWLLGYWLTMNLTQVFQTCILTWLVMLVSPELTPLPTGHDDGTRIMEQVADILRAFGSSVTPDSVSDAAVLRSIAMGSGATGVAVQSLQT